MPQNRQGSLFDSCMRAEVCHDANKVLIMEVGHWGRAPLVAVKAILKRLQSKRSRCWRQNLGEWLKIRLRMSWSTTGVRGQGRRASCTLGCMSVCGSRRRSEKGRLSTGFLTTSVRHSLTSDLVRGESASLARFRLRTIAGEIQCGGDNVAAD